MTTASFDPTLPPEERLAALEARVESWEPWRANATSRFTGLEEQVNAAGTRLQAVEQGMAPAVTRLETLERGGDQLRGMVTQLAEALGALQVQLNGIVARMDELGRSARPGRTVVHESVRRMQADLEELRARLPEDPPEGGV